MTRGTAGRPVKVADGAPTHQAGRSPSAGTLPLELRSIALQAARLRRRTAHAAAIPAPISAKLPGSGVGKGRPTA